MGERWHMSDSPPVNGIQSSDQKSGRRRHRARQDDYYGDEDDALRGKKRSRDTDDRGFGRDYRADIQGPRGERQIRFEIGAVRKHISWASSWHAAKTACEILLESREHASNPQSDAGGTWVNMTIIPLEAGPLGRMVANPGVMSQGRQSMQS